MKRSNNELKYRIDLADDKGNTLECASSEKHRAGKLNHVLGAYCKQIRQGGIRCSFQEN